MDVDSPDLILTAVDLARIADLAFRRGLVDVGKAAVKAAYELADGLTIEATGALAESIWQLQSLPEFGGLPSTYQ